MRIIRTTLAVVLFAASGALLLAHAKLEKSVPAEGATLSAPPSMIELSFSEKPDLAVSKLTIHGPSPKTTIVGTHVMEKALMATVQGDVPDGAYSVDWQTAGDDGHLQKGELKFTVKRATH